MAREPLQKNIPCPRGLHIAMVTTFVPSSESSFLEPKLAGMAKLNSFGNFIDCWILDEENNFHTQQLIHEFNINSDSEYLKFFHFSRKNNSKYNHYLKKDFHIYQIKQKSGNVNAWLDSIKNEKYDIITIIDFDHIPEQDFYGNILPLFTDNNIDFVQGPDSFQNREQNLLTLAACFERDLYFGVLHRSFFGLGMPIIVGSHTTFRADVFRDIGGYYPPHLTEDYLMMLTLISQKKKGVFLDRIIAKGEAPKNWKSYIRQQYRWASGGGDLLFRYLPKFFKSFSWKERVYSFYLLLHYPSQAMHPLARIILMFYMASADNILVPLERGSDVTLAACILWLCSWLSLLWCSQFFIEKNKLPYLISGVLITNIAKYFYLIATLNAIARYNMDFNITPKGDKLEKTDTSSRYILTTAILLIAIDSSITAALLWLDRYSINDFTGSGLLFLLASIPFMHIVVLLFWVAIERNYTHSAFRLEQAQRK